MANEQLREVIGGGRRRGKTSELIRRAFRDQLYILCANRDMAKAIIYRAKEMNLDIPHPITPDDLPLVNPFVNRVLIDEAEMVLQKMIGKSVVAMSTSYGLRELPSLNDTPKGSKSIGSLHVDIDCSDALTGLKAIQREARKATAALKEFEQAYKEVKQVAEECGVNGPELFSLLARPEVSG